VTPPEEDVTTTASKPRPSGPRAALKAIAPAEKPAEAVPEPAAGDATEAATDAPKTLMGQGVGKHTEAALKPAPLPPRGPEDCVLCGDPVPSEKVSWPFRPEPSPSGNVREYRCCPDITACLERAFAKPSQTTSEDAADHAPASSLEQPQEAAEPPLEPLPEGSA
jgi:hypothetical protein